MGKFLLRSSLLARCIEHADKRVMARTLELDPGSLHAVENAKPLGRGGQSQTRCWFDIAAESQDPVNGGPHLVVSAIKRLPQAMQAICDGLPQAAC
ncbi:hypothetical protein Mal64_30590 [Pseudobythopirellula maris]|uniref:Uncharacterized protein n=1 Tax=Pseudobythopirellula maris TaxID=2527991 RepID=A0A5C5ZK60_9BACT|nr:hypothetical protein Mal64_30590 [Pseudobythopirellula maris]